MARPKFSCFYSLHATLHQEVQQYAAVNGSIPVLHHPVYTNLTSAAAESYNGRATGYNGNSKDFNSEGVLHYGAGFDLSALQHVVNDLSMLRCDITF